MRFGLLSSVRVLVVVISCANTASFAQAAILNVTPVASPGANVNLTTLGAVDWVYYDGGSGAYASGAPTNSKLGGTAIGNATSIAGSAIVRGSTTDTIDTSFTVVGDGTSPSSTSNTVLSGAFNNTIATNGTGVATAITLATTDIYLVNLWVSGYGGTGTLNATLSGASTYTNSDFVYTTGKPIRQYTFTVQANNPGDVLNLGYTLGSLTGPDSQHVLIAAAAISLAPTAIPEPSTFALAGLGLAACGFWGLRRRRAL